MKAAETGLADWRVLKACVEFVRKNYPACAVVMNGNIQSLADVDRCLKFTKADGVMTAEGILHNPAIFSGKSPKVTKIAIEYLDIVDELEKIEVPTPNSVARLHLFKLMHHPLTIPKNTDLRDVLAKARDLTEMREMVLSLDARLPKLEELNTPEFINKVMVLPYRAVFLKCRILV